MAKGILLSETIALRLHERIASSASPFLPSVHELAMEYGVAKSTILRALHCLRDKGEVTCHPGRRVAIIRLQKSEYGRGAACESARTLSSRIKEEITSGRWKMGVALPKFSYFQFTYRMSNNSILDALKLCEAKGLVHKHGKKWIAGPAPGAAPASGGPIRAKQPWTALLILPSYDFWSAIVQQNNNYYSTLLQTFLGEMEHSGHQVAIGYLHSAARVTSKPADILAFARDLGQHYMGAFIWVIAYAEPLIRRLLHMRKPVVGFHQMPPNDCFAHASQLFTYCQTNEVEAVRAMLENLAALGHRTIAVMQVEKNMQNGECVWINDRTEIIHAQARAFYPHLQIVPILQKEEFWFRHDWWNRENFFEQFLRGHLSDLQRRAPDGRKLTYRRALAACAPSLAAVVNHPAVTALMAPNDLLARLYFVWLKEYGIAVPRDLSLTGFDNDFGSRHFPLPLTTVDFNLSGLAYQAAHIIIGDLPIETAKNRILSTKCTFINRESVGVPHPRKSKKQSP